MRFDLSFFFLTCLADTSAHALIHNPELRSAPGCVCFGDGPPIETMQLHFTKDVLPDSVGTDFQNLNKLNEQVSLALTEQLYRKLSETRGSLRQWREVNGHSPPVPARNVPVSADCQLMNPRVNKLMSRNIAQASNRRRQPRAVRLKCTWCAQSQPPSRDQTAFSRTRFESRLIDAIGLLLTNNSAARCCGAEWGRFCEVNTPVNELQHLQELPLSCNLITQHIWWCVYSD